MVVIVDMIFLTLKMFDDINVMLTLCCDVNDKAKTCLNILLPTHLSVVSPSATAAGGRTPRETALFVRSGGGVVRRPANTVMTRVKRNY